MSLGDLVQRIRAEFISDTTGNDEARYLWKTPGIVSALMQAERELCRRVFCITDSTTPAICQLAVAPGGRSYVTDNRILQVKRLKFPGVALPLPQKTTPLLDAQDPRWDEASGTPTCFVRDQGKNVLTFDRSLTVNGTVQMIVTRLPLVRLTYQDLNSDMETTGLDDELIHGALKYLYLRPDIEGYDAKLSAYWRDQFEADIATILLDRAAGGPSETVSQPEFF
jgi:hypothetical protein